MSRLQLSIGILGLVLLVGAPVAFFVTRPPDAVGDVRALGGGAELAQPDVSAQRTPRSSPPPSRAASAAQPSATDTSSRATQETAAAPVVAPSATRSGRLDSVAAASVAAPARLRIPAIGVDAAVVDVGVEPDGEMEIPEDVTTAGWYRFGPSPGEAGSAVVAGHVDSRTQGLGIFAELRSLAPGARVEVEFDDASSQSFTVVARQEIDKPSVPLDAVFDRASEPKLTLITCGGDFDATQRSYESNVIVTAVPV